MIFNGIYKNVDRLGRGSLSEIYKVLNKRDGKYYALKCIANPENDDDLRRKFDNEIKIMKNIKSKYMVNLIENFYDKYYESYCIVMELCDGNLRNLLNKYKPKGLPLELINKIFLQLNDVLKAMLKINCIHRDLKPDNILIKYTDNVNFDIKLTDFGLSKININAIIETHTEGRGTLLYEAPEIETGYYNNQCDLWSLGVFLYELYTNKYIFDSGNKKEIKNNRENGRIINETDNEMINKLIRKLIQVDINKRLNWEEYFNDDFFKQQIIKNNINKDEKNENQQIIKIKINVYKDNEIIKIYNGNKDIDEKNIKLFIDNKEIKNNINNLKKGNYIIIMIIEQIITNCEKMFYKCKNINEIEFIIFDTKNVTNMSHMFDGCSSLKNVNLNNFDTKNVTNMSYMFFGCSSLENLNLNNFDTKNVTNMSYMFYDCSSLKNLNINNFDTKNVTDMSHMFNNCKSLKNLNLNNFDTENVINMDGIFYGCDFRIS
jgi:surface protein